MNVRIRTVRASLPRCVDGGRGGRARGQFWGKLGEYRLAGCERGWLKKYPRYEI